MPAFETLYTHHTEVACDGESGPLGHPRVYLHIESETGHVTCPYCSRTFIYQPSHGQAHHG